MKTTIELPDTLFAAAKAAAARRRTTLNAMMEQALRREIAYDEKPAPDAHFELNEKGFPVLKKRKAASVTNKKIYRIMDEEGL
ncbi:MAG: hypothetical protein FJ405_08560 [Verrucomicrobia bacterium]|nr:hypothetical protein [Verrucomicrobiota bacterium]